MTATFSSRCQALFCALVLLLCALASFPVAEIGINDDWSYVQSARVLAQTGHIVYNGFGAIILGWQLLLGALFVQLFGPSFTAIRFSTLLVSLFIAYLMHRILVRTGVSPRNAVIGTLALVLSPLFLPLAVSFMSDIGGLFVVVLCLYACLRAIQAQSNPAVLAWLVFAALSNALGGTIRQIAWLGVLIMFPCAAWLLRRRPHVLLSAALLYLVSIAIIYASLHWFAQQPYSVPEPLWSGSVDRHWDRLVMQLWLPLSFAMLLLPILAAFIPAIPIRNPRSVRFLVFGAVLCAGAGLILFPHHPLRFNVFLAPYKGMGAGNYVNASGLGAAIPTTGLRPAVLSFGPRMALSITVLLVLLCFFTFLSTTPRPAPPAQSPPVTWKSLLLLTVPFTLAYLALLVPRGLRGSMLRGDIVDRYLLLILPIALVLLLRLFYDRVQPNLPLFSVVFVLLYALYAVAGTHDLFSMYRARLAAINQIRAAGIPDTSIDGGWEQDAMIQVQRCGFLNDPFIRMPAADRLIQPSSLPGACQSTTANLTPVIVPRYSVSFDPPALGAPSRFSPVTYRNWLGLRTVTLHIVNTAATGNGQR